MAEELLQYDQMVEKALRSVVRDALALTLEHGLYGDHHFYITFATTHSGVRMANRLRMNHPEEMTIVLQHQFRDLAVGENGFEVTLVFSGVSEKLCIPYAAVTAFADPSAKFGLQFQTVVDDAPDDDSREPSRQWDGGGAKVVALDAFRKK